MRKIYMCGTAPPINSANYFPAFGDPLGLSPRSLLFERVVSVDIG